MEGVLQAKHLSVLALEMLIRESPEWDEAKVTMESVHFVDTRSGVGSYDNKSLQFRT